MWSDINQQGSGENPGPYFSSLKWGEKMHDIKYPRFWGTVDYIRRNYRWVEPCLGTKGLLRITRDLMDHWRSAMFSKGLFWARSHWYEHIDEYIREQEGKIHGKENYVLAAEEYDFFRDQFTEH